MAESILSEQVRALVDDPGHALVQEARASGLRVVGYTCSFVPEPILSVPGLMPQRLRAPGTCGTPMADTYLSSVLCSYPRSLLERYLDMGLDYVDGFVFVASCDHIRRLYDNLVYLQEPGFHCILDLPHKRGEHAIAWYTEELRRLCGALAEHFEVAVDRDTLRSAIGAHNEHLARLRALDALRLRHPPALSGADFHRLLIASATAPKHQLTGTLATLLGKLEGASAGRPPRARLMVLGSTLDDPAYLATIESVGGAVVADRFCFGGMPGLAPIPCGDDPVESLARHALESTQCPRMMGDFESRIAYLLEMVRTRQVDGVVLETMKFCDLWGVEAGPTADALRQAGVPVLRVEREVASLAEGQLRTRVQAFLESLGR